MQIEVSNGELIDKLTIAEIKQLKGLAVSKELDILTNTSSHLFQQTPQINHLYQVLTTINNQLWTIEDDKRNCEQNKTFGQEFVNLARLVYMLNDQRAKTKKQIDLLTNSEISEQKSHTSV